MVMVTMAMLVINDGSGLGGDVGGNDRQMIGK